MEQINRTTIAMWATLFITAITYTSSYAALSTPTHQNPTNAQINVNPAYAQLRVYGNGGYWYRFQLDSSSNFSSPFMQDTTGRTTFMIKDSLKLNQTYYWRCKSYNFDKSDSSPWSAPWSFKTLKSLEVNFTQPYFAGEWFTFNGSRLPNYTQLSMEFMMDTTDLFNSPFLQFTDGGSLELPFDSTVFYFRYRTIYAGDTSAWSATWSKETQFYRIINLTDNCVNLNDYIRFNAAVYSGYNKPTFRITTYEDSLLSRQMHDSTYTGSTYFRVDWPLLNCEPLWASIQIFGKSDTFRTVQKYAPCQQADNISLFSPFQQAPDSNSFRIQARPCVEAFELEMDTTYSFNSNWLKEFSSPINVLLDTVIPFDKDPINFVARYRWRTGGRWSDWHVHGPLYIMYLNWSTNSKPEDSTSFDCYYNGYAVRHTGFSYTAEMQQDVSENFDSPKLTSINFAQKDVFGLQRIKEFIYGDYIYTRIRLVSPNGKGAWSNVIKKKTVTRPRISGSNPFTLGYPYFNVNTYPQTYNTNVLFQYALDSLFTPSNTTQNLGNVNPKLINGRIYYVRAKYINSIDSSEWSETHLVETKNNSNYIIHPFLVYPNDSAQITDLNNVNFIWKPQVDDRATGYVLFIYEDKIQPDNIVYYNLNPTITETSVNFLKPNKQYYWTVLAVGNVIRKGPEENRVFFTNGFLNNHFAELLSEQVFYPNPTTGLVHLNEAAMADVKSISVIGLDGKLMFSSNKEVNQIDLSHLPKATYLMQIEYLNRQPVVQPIVVR